MKVNPRLSFATDVYKQDKCAFIIVNTNWTIKENLGGKGLYWLFVYIL